MAIPETKYPQSQTTSPAGFAIPVVPSDTIDIAEYSREIYVGTGGDLTLMMGGDEQVVTFVGVPDGARLPYIAKRIMATGTTASNIVAVW